MALSDELARLHELHQRGGLTDDEYARAKAQVLQGAPARGGSASPTIEAINDMRRSREDRWIAGVCGGLSDATGLDAWVWRLLFTVLLFAGGAGLVIYVLMWVFVPAA